MQNPKENTYSAHKNEDRTARVLLQSLTKSFGAENVLSGIDLEIENGEFIVFVGPSGCGKSTILRMISGLESVDSGSIVIGENDVTHTPAAKRGVAMVFQSYALYPHMSVRQNMEFGLKIAKTKKSKIRKLVAAAAEKLQITELLDRRPGQLSGGQRQRVAIGRAIVKNPLIFLFDEPLSNLDAELRVGMRIELTRLHSELGNTMIYVTHDQTEAMTLADRIVVLRAGKIEQIGTPKQIYEDPCNTFVAGFIGSPSMNMLSGKWLGEGVVELGNHKILTGLATKTIKIGETVTIGVRPENLSLGNNGDLSIQANLEATEYLGGTRFVYTRTNDEKTLVIQCRTDTEPKIGEIVEVSANLNDLRYFDASGLRLY